MRSRPLYAALTFIALLIAIRALRVAGLIPFTTVAQINPLSDARDGQAEPIVVQVAAEAPVLETTESVINFNYSADEWLDHFFTSALCTKVAHIPRNEKTFLAHKLHTKYPGPASLQRTTTAVRVPDNPLIGLLLDSNHLWEPFVHR